MLKRNFFTILSGTALAQVLQIAAYPFIARLYEVADLGVYALYLATVSIGGVAVNGEYHQAIALAGNKTEAEQLRFLSIITGTIVTLTLSLLCLIATFAGLISDDILSLMMLAFITAGTLLGAYHHTHISYQAKSNRFKLISAGRITQAGSLLALQLGIALLGYTSANVLIGSHIASLLLGLIPLLTTELSTLKQMKLSRGILSAHARKNINFPRYRSFTVILTSISSNIPVMLSGIFFGKDASGFVSLTQRVISAPVSLLGESARTTFYVAASDLKNSGKAVLPLFQKVSKGLFLLGIAPFLGIMLFGEEIFGFIFGSEWEMSGTLARIWSPLALVILLGAPTSMALNLYGKQGLNLIFEICAAVFTIGAFFIAGEFGKNLVLCIGAYVLVQSASALLLRRQTTLILKSSQ